MTAEANIQSKTSQLLRRSLQADGAVVGLSGIVLMVGAGPIASFLGVNVPLVLIVMGVIFVLYGAAVLWAVTRQAMARQVGYAVASLNTIWVLVSVAILLTDWIPLSTQGQWVVTIVAVIVAAFAAVQFYALRTEGS